MWTHDGKGKMMHRKWRRVIFCVLLAACIAGCGKTKKESTEQNENVVTENKKANEELAKEYDAVSIILDDAKITVDGEDISTSEDASVYATNDIVFYLEGQDFTYGEGTKDDEHSQKEADAHTVVHITKPGNYVVSGSLSKGQIAVNLGEEAEKNQDAVVTLILNNADITCEVAPAVIFYEVYECGSDKEEDANSIVDTKAAGANVIIADGSVNNITGSYVAKIYKSVELNEDKTEITDSEKLHKYDGAFYSKMSMNINGEEENTGILNIKAENEGLDTELHLTINGGNINITSGNDGINTNEDGISVTTINGGNLNIIVDGSTGGGDGIDSNGWLVINGGTVTAYACSFSQDAGIDSDKGIYINGGTVLATGNMLDEIADSEQTYLVFSFDSSVETDSPVLVRNENGEVISECIPANNFTYLLISNVDLAEGTYSLWNGDSQMYVAKTENGMRGGKMPKQGDKENPQMPDGERPQQPDGEKPQMPEGERPQMPGGGRGFDNENMQNMEWSTEFVITTDGNMFAVSGQPQE